jgi:hypothetical protein
MGDEEGYDMEELKRIWGLDYKALALAPGEPGGRLRDARFVMQAKSALETSSLSRMTLWMAVATGFMALATISLAVTTFIK